MEWQYPLGNIDSLYPPNSPSPGHSIVPDVAPIPPFSESSITAALYSIMVTLIKVPSPDPFPEWNLPPLPQSWDNEPCYNREQGPTVSRLLAYSPGLIILTLWGTMLLGKALALGSLWGTQIPLHMYKDNSYPRTNQKTAAQGGYHMHNELDLCSYTQPSQCITNHLDLSHANKYYGNKIFNFLVAAYLGGESHSDLSSG